MSDALPTADPLALLQHRAWVRALARRIVADENAVDDVEQDTWAAALRSGPDEPRALRTWLGRVASRFALQRLRGEGRRARREAEIAMAQGDGGTVAASAPTCDVVAEADLHGHVVQAVLALDEPYRTTILLRYFEGLTIADVAARMDVPVETVRTRLRRAHEQLRARLEREHARSASALLAPLLAAEAAPAPVAAPAGFGLGAALVGSAAIVAAVVGIVALGGWTLGRLTAPGSGAGRAAGVVLPQQAPPPAPPGTPADPKVVAPPPEAPVEDRCIVRDLWDGKPVAGLEVWLLREGARDDYPSTLTTDAEGRIPVKLLDGDALLISDSRDGRTWIAGTGVLSVGAATREVWVARKVTVRGRVRPDSADDPWIPERAVVHVELTPAGTDWTCLPAGLPRTEAERALGYLGYVGASETGTPPSGAFELEAPLVAGAVVQVSAKGRISMVKPLADGVELDFALRPAIHLRGLLADASGAPLPSRSVDVFAIASPRDGSVPVWANPDAPKVERLPDGRALIRQRAQTDRDGRFDVEVADTWDVTVDLRVPGLRRVVWKLGAVVRDHRLTMRGEAPTDADSRAIRIRGSSPGVARLAVTERGGVDPVAFTVPVNADGRFDSSWFDRDRDYELSLWGPLGADARPATPENAPRLVRWTGADLDWDTLPLLDAATPGTGK